METLNDTEDLVCIEWIQEDSLAVLLEVVQRSHPRSSSLLTLVYVIYSQWSNIIQL